MTQTRCYICGAPTTGRDIVRGNVVCRQCAWCEPEWLVEHIGNLTKQLRDVYRNQLVNVYNEVDQLKRQLKQQGKGR